MIVHGADIHAAPLSLSGGGIRSTHPLHVLIVGVGQHLRSSTFNHFADLAPPDVEHVRPKVIVDTSALAASAGNLDFMLAGENNSDRLTWLFYTDEAVRRRFEAAMKTLRDFLAPEQDRHALRRDARTSVLIPGERGAIRRSLRPDVKLASGLAPSTIQRFLKPTFENFKEWARFEAHERAHKTAARLFWLRAEVRPINSALPASKVEFFKRPAIARTVGRCRAGYIKFLSWKVAFDRTEIITLIRRLDFRGMGSIKEALLGAVLSLIQLWSDYVRRQVDLRGSASCARSGCAV